MTAPLPRKAQAAGEQALTWTSKHKGEESTCWECFGDSRDREDNNIELTKSVERVGVENLENKSSNSVLLVASGDSMGGSDSSLTSNTRNRETDKRSAETDHEGAECLERSLNVVSGNVTPSSGETKDTTTGRENISSFRYSDIHSSETKA